MALLDDFKTSVGITGATPTDQYIIDYYLTPAIDKASELSSNIKQTEITLTQGTNSYDLTSSSIANPVVSSAGVQEIIISDYEMLPYDYKRDFYFSTPTTLYFVDADEISGKFTLRYNEFYSKPTTAPTETNMPSRLFAPVLKWASTYYKLIQLTSSSEFGGIKSIRESNLEKDFGSSNDVINGLQLDLAEAEEEIARGAGGAFNFYSESIV